MEEERGATEARFPIGEIDEQLKRLVAAKCSGHIEFEKRELQRHG